MPLKTTFKISKKSRKICIPGRPPGLLLPALKQIPGNLPFQAGRKPDQPLVVLGQNLPVNPGTVVETLKMRPGDQLREVAVTLEVPGQEHEMKRRLVRRAPFLVQAAPGRARSAGG